MVPISGNGRNGTWRGWVLGIVATVVASLIINGILFQRETRRDLGEHEVMLKYLTQRIDERTAAPFNSPDAERELRIRDEAIRRLQQRIERLEDSK